MQIEVLGERYELLGPIGRGGMATIYRGRDTHMDRTVAIKVLREVYSTDPKFVTRFQREAKAASALQHPNIVQVYDYGQTDGNYFIVMELVEGTDLRRYLRSRGVLDVDRAIIIAHDVALGLGAAHRRSIVHRDVKPQNVLVGKGGSIKLTDFGIASVYKDINAERLTTTGMTLGTVQYYAPEQAQGEIVSPAADVYALGIVMYEMLTGRTPFDGDTPVAVAMQHIQDAPVPPRELNPGIPPSLEDIILRCLEKIPEMRLRDGSQLARALETLGEADNSEMATNQFLAQSSAPVPITFNTLPNSIPSRPSTSGRSNPQQPVASSSNPSLNARVADDPANDAAGYKTPGIAGISPQFEQQQAAAVNQQPYSSFEPQSMDARATPTRPYLAGAQPSENRSGRLAGIITTLIILATVLLLGFSIYLAADLGFINLPFSNNTNALPSPTVTAVGTVPNLIGDTWAQAQDTATHAGFQLTSQNGEDGVVQSQSYPAGSSLSRGSIVEVKMGATQPTTQVPDVEGQPLSSAQQLLQAAGLKYTIQSAGTDPTKQANTVIRSDPSGGTSVNPNSTITLYVVNYTPNGTAPVFPTAIPTATAHPTPTARPTVAPTPTTARPTSTPTTPPIPTTTPTPSTPVP